MARVGPASHVTLHYRLAVVIDGEEREVVSTLDTMPATLQLGAGGLAPPLEGRLVGLDEGACVSFDLPAGEAFGLRSSDLVQTLSRSTFDKNAETDGEYAPGDIVQFRAPDGGRYSGVLKDRGERRVVVDFNHPLAGLPLRFSVKIIGVL